MKELISFTWQYHDELVKTNFHGQIKSRSQSQTAIHLTLIFI